MLGLQVSPHPLLSPQPDLQLFVPLQLELEEQVEVEQVELPIQLHGSEEVVRTSLLLPWRFPSSLGLPSRVVPCSAVPQQFVEIITYLAKGVNKKIIFLLTPSVKCGIFDEIKTHRINTMNCPRCQRLHFVKNGCVNSVQRYKCKACHYQWTRTIPRGCPPEQKTLAVLLYCHGISMNALSKLFQISATAVLKMDTHFCSKTGTQTHPFTRNPCCFGT